MMENVAAVTTAEVAVNSSNQNERTQIGSSLLLYGKTCVGGRFNEIRGLFPALKV